jgi:hypothetical protein
MTLLFCDSFDHYASGALMAKGYVNLGANGSIGPYGRHGTNGIAFGSNYGMICPVAGAPASVVVGIACKATNTTTSRMLALVDGATSQVDIYYGVFGDIYVTRNGTELARTAPGLIVEGAYNYVEIKATIDPVAGAVVVRLNGITVINLAGVNTRATATSQVTGLYLGGSNFGNRTYWYDDLYICNTAGARNNDFLGDVRVQAILPDGAGNYAQWDGLVGAATHWQAQNQNPPDDDATYVSDSLAIPGHLDSYTLGNVIPTSGIVPAVQVSAWTRKDDAGVRTIATMVRSGAADAVGANVNLANTYGFVTQVYELDPAAAAWTIAKVNALEAGVKAVA